MIPPRLRPILHGRLDCLQSRLLTPVDAGAIMALRAEVLARLPNPDLYVRESDEEGFVHQHLAGAGSGSGETIGVFHAERLVAYAMLGLPAVDDADNLARYFLPAVADPARAAHLASCMVLEPYRGRHLQRMLLVARIALAQAHGRDFCVAMVSLHNHASRHNMMCEGLRIGWVGEIDGLRRQLLAIHADRSWLFDHQAPCLVGAADWQRQRELTRQGWWGVGVHGPRDDRHQLAFARRIA